MDAPGDKPTEYGSEMRKHFLMAEDYTNLNHGSYGTIPRQVQDTRRAFQDEIEARIDLYVKVKQARYIDASRAAIAKYLNAPVDECVFVRNATNGVNTALRNLNFQRRDIAEKLFRRRRLDKGRSCSPPTWRDTEVRRASARFLMIRMIVIVNLSLTPRGLERFRKMCLI
ncbi:hypothetical protein KEM56_002994 [Ascosphaera pollenicola]|nr:hypothetical protein KEM56_002994 [Ascosphaera pollenicola]